MNKSKEPVGGKQSQEAGRGGGWGKSLVKSHQSTLASVIIQAGMNHFCFLITLLCLLYGTSSACMNSGFGLCIFNCQILSSVYALPLSPLRKCGRWAPMTCGMFCKYVLRELLFLGVWFLCLRVIVEVQKPLGQVQNLWELFLKKKKKKLLGFFSQ